MTKTQPYTWLGFQFCIGQSRESRFFLRFRCWSFTTLYITGENHSRCLSERKNADEAVYSRVRQHFLPRTTYWSFVQRFRSYVRNRAEARRP